MAYDLLLKNGTVVDGTGAPRFRADIAIAGDRIAEIGKISDGAKRVIDASDLIVSPGFIDPHTHYDAQICWDPLLSCTSWHGITSVVMGNCGVGVAPCKPEAREIAAWDLTNVEAIPYASLTKGITWEWETFPEFLDAAHKRGSAVNLGFLAPLTPFRHYVMGTESMERAATREETDKIAALLGGAMAAGAFGFSTTTLRQHIGFHGSPLACRLASRDELKSYANVLKQAGKGSIEVALETLGRLEPLINRGGIPQVLCKPFSAQLDLRNPFSFADNASWGRVFNQPVEAQKQIYVDPEFRRQFRDSLKRPHLFMGHWHRVEILEATNPALKQYEGKSVNEVAEMRGADGLDTFLDLAVEDDLNLQYIMQQYHEEGIQQLISDPRTMIGLSDGGAHVDMLCDAGYTTYLLGNWVRNREAVTLEFAVKRITSEPANFFGIRERGQLKQGYKADITIFDYNTVNSARRAKMAYDLPGGGRRLVMPAEGIEYTIVNGRMSYEHRKQSGALAGEVMRSTAS